MAWFRNKKDPLSDRERALADEIARIETEIKRLGSRLPESSGDVEPEPAPRPVPSRQPEPTPVAQEPIFEKVDPKPLIARTEPAATSGHYNDLGVRKYDLPDLLRRIRNHLRGPAASNPKLINYLAAGGIQGLRPMRYEKRVARNRFIALVVVLFLTLLGIIAVFVRH